MDDVGVAGPPCRLQPYPDSTRQASAKQQDRFFLGVRWHLVGRSPTQEGENQGLVAKSCGGASVRRPGSFGQTAVASISEQEKASQDNLSFGRLFERKQPTIPYNLSSRQGGRRDILCKQFEIPTAVRLLKVAETLHAAYSRMVLLRSPSRFVPLPCRVRATLSDDIFFKGTAVTDGQAEVSVEFGQRIGLLPTKIVKDNLPLTNGNTAIKRMLAAVRASPGRRVSGVAWPIASKEALPRCFQNADYVSFMIYPGFHPAENLESLAAREGREGRVEDVDAGRKRRGGREGRGGPRRSAGNIGITVVWCLFQKA